MDFYQFLTPLGLMALASEGDFITHLYLPSYPTPRLASHPTSLLLEGERQLLEYLGGQRKTFDLPLNPQGTPFQRRVWQALEAIPWGEIRSYRDIAPGVPGGGHGQPQSPHPHLHPLPPGGGSRRLPHRLRRRTGAEKGPPGSGGTPLLTTT